jgi:hypothetical protein
MKVRGDMVGFAPHMPPSGDMCTTHAPGPQGGPGDMGRAHMPRPGLGHKNNKALKRHDLPNETRPGYFGTNLWPLPWGEAQPYRLVVL